MNHSNEKSHVPIVVCVSGGFDPVHIGHIHMFQEAKKLGDKLVVILNGDNWLVRKKGAFFMPASERAEIIRAIRDVDDVFVWDDDTADVCGALEILKPHIFANGGDRKKETDIPEASVCQHLGIKMVFNVGGEKIQSSSRLLQEWSA